MKLPSRILVLLGEFGAARHMFRQIPVFQGILK